MDPLVLRIYLQDLLAFFYELLSNVTSMSYFYELRMVMWNIVFMHLFMVYLTTLPVDEIVWRQLAWWLVGDSLESIWRDAILIQLEQVCNSSICLERLKKTRKMCQNSRSPNRERWSHFSHMRCISHKPVDFDCWFEVWSHASFGHEDQWLYGLKVVRITSEIPYNFCSATSCSTKYDIKTYILYL